MKRALPTASQLHLAHKCSWPWDPAAVWEETTSEAAERGTTFHACVADLLRDGFGVEHRGVDDSVWSLIQAWKAWAAGSGVPTTGTFGLSYEVPVGVWQNGVSHVFDDISGRDYPDIPGGIFGTADFVDYDPDDEATVYDWKTGRRENTEPAASNHQLSMLAHAFGAKRVALVFVSESGVEVDEAEPMPFEWPEMGGPPQPGDHCNFCPARKSCPALSGAASDLGLNVGEAGLVPVFPPSPAGASPARALSTRPLLDLTTPGGIVAARAAIRLVEDKIKAVETEIRSQVEAAGGALDLGNGRALRLTKQTRTSYEWNAEDMARADLEGRMKTTEFTVLKETKA